MSRPAVSFIAWTRISGRSAEIADALGGESRTFFDLDSVDRRLAPLRYAVSGTRTLLYLLRRRPRAVIVTNPPIFPALISYAYGLIARAPIILDSHPSSFGFDAHNTVVRIGMPFHRYLMPRVKANLVTEASLAEMVEAEGGRAEILHEAEPRWTMPAAPPLGERPRILFVSMFNYDEPTAEVVEAAREMPEVDFTITGDLAKRPAEIAARATPNVHFPGFLDQAGYLDAIRGANVVVSLTKRPEDVSRVGYEAVFARRPLVLSDWPASARYFPAAVVVENTPEGIAAGLRRAIAEYPRLTQAAEDARRVQVERWEGQLDTLRELVGVS